MDRRRALGIGLVVVAGASFASGSIFATLSYAEGLDWLDGMTASTVRFKVFPSRPLSREFPRSIIGTRSLPGNDV